LILIVGILMRDKSQIIGFFFLICILLFSSCKEPKPDEVKRTKEFGRKQLAQKILNNQDFRQVLNKAKEILRKGLNAGDGYCEVWIRDLNTFIELSCEVNNTNMIKKNLLKFFEFQGADGNIIDGFIPGSEKMHKNTVETDQETSLIQAVDKYINKTGDSSILQVTIDNRTVLDRMELALEFLLRHRYSEKYGLLWGATTADWGDVQPEEDWGVHLTENTHKAIDIYDNAMFVIAISNYLSFVQHDDKKASRWNFVLEDTRKNIRTHLWNGKKFIPHIYLDTSPFSRDFNEDEIYYHGGTAVAIESDLLSKHEIEMSMAAMIDNKNKAGAQSIGLTLYPCYPEGFFKNPIMAKKYSYQNGGDWTWFGGRMIQEMVRNGFIEEAYCEIVPMVERVQKNNGFFEWYTIDGQPRGSGTYRGSAGVLGEAIQMLVTWAENNKGK
ncbi:MAG: hypothetical protein KAV87_48140, partial [Desulfobacteraceae bacterium]|nr:hypothetical protein [Desulfobacteraceae bacterium]